MESAGVLPSAYKLLVLVCAVSSLSACINSSDSDAASGLLPVGSTNNSGTDLIEAASDLQQAPKRTVAPTVGTGSILVPYQPVAFSELSTPVIEPGGGSFVGSVVVTLNTNSAEAGIFYTVDGSTPTESALRYEGPFSRTTDTTIKAIAILAGYPNSAVADASFTVSPVAANTVGTVFQQDLSGQIVIEAEHFETMVARNSHSWVETFRPGFSGDSAMMGTPDSGLTANSSLNTNAAEMSYRINFNRKGDHFVRIRGVGADWNGDSVWAGINGNADTAKRFNLSRDDYSWSGDVRLAIPSTGEHRLTIWLREDGVIVDKIILSPENSAPPSGSGPQESLRSVSGAPSVFIPSPPASDPVTTEPPQAPEQPVAADPELIDPIQLAPTLEGLPGRSAVVDDPYVFSPTAADPDGDRLTFEISNLPSWLSFDSGSGTISGTPGTADIGSHRGISISVTDGVYITTLGPFRIDVDPETAQSVTLSWTIPNRYDDGTRMSDLQGYELHYGLVSGNYTEIVNVSSPTDTVHTIDGLTPGTYFFVSAAYNQFGVRSKFSNEVSITLN